MSTNLKRRLDRIEGPPRRKPGIWLFAEEATGRTYRDSEMTDEMTDADVEELQKTHRVLTWEFVTPKHVAPDLPTNGLPTNSVT